MLTNFVRLSWLCVVLGGIVVSCRQAEHVIVPDEPVFLPAPPPVDVALIQTLLPFDSIKAIDEPQFETAEVAATHLNPSERLIGVVINGEARAYPIPILSTHEIVNDTIGGEPIAITWCPLCYSALVFSRQVRSSEEPLTFAVSGKLLQNTLVMSDRQTGSLWSQLYGAAVDGPFAGESLAIFPSVLTDWQTWYQQHPQSQVLSKSLTCEQFRCGNYANNPRHSYAIDPYAAYYNTADEGMIDRQIPREEARVGVKKRVLGIRLGGQARAYPYDVLQERPLWHDEMSSVPLLIWFEAESQTGGAFIRQVGEQVLTFIVTEEEGIVRDEQTASQWQTTSGIAISGPLAGTRLGTPAVTSAFEFGWYGYFPQSETFNP